MFYFFVQYFSFFPLFLILNCITIFVFKRWLGPLGTFYSSITALFLVIVSVLTELFYLIQTGSYCYIDFGRWFFCLNLIDSHLVFCIDTLGLLTALLVSILTMLALYFGSEYMYKEAFINRLLYLLNMFATSVILLFIVYDFFLILIAWELIGLFSLLLVNFYSIRVYTIKAALKTFIFSRISDMFIFLVFILIILVYNTTDLSLIFLQTPFLIFHRIFFYSISIHFLTVITFFIVIAGGIKGAQFFSHVWLPDAMEAPTPASALIHSSTLVIMGVYLIIRCSVFFEFTIFSNYFLAFLGSATIGFGAVSATFQNDIKKLVAYSTISQIGYLFCGCGFFCYEEVLIYLTMHAVNKAFLFILVGYIVHYFNGNTDLRFMGGMFLYSFDLAVFLFGVCFNLTGLPLSAGFFSKEFLLFQTFKGDFISFFIRSFWFISFLFTPIYMFMLVFNVVFSFKKGNINLYQHNWLFRPLDFFKFSKNNSFSYLYSYFQFSIFTSRATIYVLLCFWVFFFFFGETFTLLLYNFLNFSEVFTYSYFFSFKNIPSFSIWVLGDSLLLNTVKVVLISTSASLLYLVFLKIFNRFSLYNFFIFDFILLFILLFI